MQNGKFFKLLKIEKLPGIP